MKDSIEIKPIENIDAEVSIPGSKSYTNRALIIAALADGKSLLKNALFSDDTKYMAQALREFGIGVIENEKEKTFEVDGTGGKLKTPKKEIFIGNAGTAMRFLTSFSALADGKSTVTGNGRMQQRPIKDLVEGLNQLGASIKSKNGNGCPPLLIDGRGLKGGKAVIKGSTSSQYFTSILISAPYAENDVEIEVDGELTSKPYIDVTIDVMKKFGVKVENDNYHRFKVKSGQIYKANEYTIEGDASNASYFFAAAAITGGTVRCKNVNPHSAQGDVHFADVLEEMGCKIEKGDGWIEVTGGELNGIKKNMNMMPDMVQTLAVVAAFAKGNTKAFDVENLRVKETDRIDATKTELEKMGIKVETTEDSITIQGGSPHKAEIETYDDHRMAMAFSIAGLKVPGTIIKNPSCVSKSFPDFFEKLEELYK